MKVVFQAQPENPSRRRILVTTLAVAAGAAAFGWRRMVAAQGRLPDTATGDVVTLVKFSDSGAKLGVEQVPKLVRAEADWWGRLTPQQFYVTRHHSTDTPFSGTYFQMHEAGLFRCICCETALFSSDAKYDSGTGWPSFWQPIAQENVRAVESEGLSQADALMSGIEVLCKRCDAHLGHIFSDGPPPTNLRYCINESSLRFFPGT